MQQHRRGQRPARGTAGGIFASNGKMRSCFPGNRPGTLVGELNRILRFPKLDAPLEKRFQFSIDEIRTFLLPPMNLKARP